jgi:uncharacterized membrane protein
MKKPPIPSLNTLLWLVPLVIHVAYLATTAQRLPASVGAGIETPGTPRQIFVASWALSLILSNAALIWIALRLDSFRDHLLSVPRKDYWLGTARRRRQAVSRIMSIVETALFSLNVFFLSIYQLIYQTNVATPLVSFPRIVLIVGFTATPLFLFFITLVSSLLRFQREAAPVQAGEDERDPGDDEEPSAPGG